MIFKTEYKGKPQFWEAHLDTNSSFLKTDSIFCTYSDKPSLHVWEDWIKNIKNGVTLENIKIVALSITDENQEVKDRNQYRGFNNDENPFIINGKEYGEIDGHFRKGHYNHNLDKYEDDPYVYFQSSSYGKGGCLTDAAKKHLEKAFSEQLVPYFTDENLQILINECIEYNKKRVVKQAEEMKTQAEKVLDFFEKE